MLDEPKGLRRSDVLENRLTKYEREQIEELEKPILHILKELQPAIDKGEYTLLISDDRSGRIPAMILGWAVKYICEAKKLEHPLFRPLAASTRDLGGLAQYKAEALDEHVKKIRDTLDKRGTAGRALVVSEFISTGKGLDTLMETLAANNIARDVAVVGLSPGVSKRELEEKWKCRVIEGGLSKIPAVYGTHLSGIKKSHAFQIFSEPNNTSREKVQNSRLYAMGIASKIAQDYLERYPARKR